MTTRRPRAQSSSSPVGRASPVTSRLPGYPFTSRWYAHPGRGGLRQHYLDEGSGPPVLFVHGNPSWSHLWRRPIAAPRRAFRCVAPTTSAWACRTSRPTTGIGTRSTSAWPTSTR